jgi:hypothetical protein
MLAPPNDNRAAPAGEEGRSAAASPGSRGSDGRITITSAARRPGRWRALAPTGGGPLTRRHQVQMLSLAVLGAKVEAGCGVVRGPALAVLP